MSLDFFGLGQRPAFARGVVLRIAVPSFRLPDPQLSQRPARRPLSREEVTAAFADVIGPKSRWTKREREDQDRAARIRAAIYS